jgi:hypothetical protein
MVVLHLNLIRLHVKLILLHENLIRVHLQLMNGLEPVFCLLHATPYNANSKLAAKAPIRDYKRREEKRACRNEMAIRLTIVFPLFTPFLVFYNKHAYSYVIIRYIWDAVECNFDAHDRVEIRSRLTDGIECVQHLFYEHACMSSTF